MSQQNLFHSEEDELWGVRAASHRQRRGQLYPPHITNPQEMKTMTIDRIKASGSDKDPNPYGTMPRINPSPYAKIKSIGVFTNLFVTNREVNIVEEELNYLKAVEAGDLEEVQDIFRSNVPDSDDSDNGEEEVKVNGVKDSEMPPKPPPRPRRKVSLENVIKKVNSNNTENPVVVEMVELDVNSSQTDGKLPLRKHFPQAKRPSTHALWQKAATSQPPLPVSLANQSPHMRRKAIKNTLTVASNDSTPRKRKTKFNKNCRDQWGRSALFIAMIHYNMEMLDLLLRYKVEIGECLYHAIDFRYYDVVELFMQYDTDISQMITGDDSFYPPGLTPFQLAAHKNDYVMLKILHAHGYRISSESKKRAFSKKYDPSVSIAGSQNKQGSVLEQAWDRSNHQILYYRAIASPAYLVMTFNESLEDDVESTWDFLENIFSLYGKLKKKVSDQPTVRSLYMPLADQVEEFACDLLSEVRSSTDLANLLRFDPPGQPRLTSQRNYLTPVQRGIEVRMKRFVAHENSQLAISSLRLGTLFDSEHGWRTLRTRILLAMIFPILCLAFIVAPDSKVGKLLRNPIVNMSCHITSEIMFLILMILRLVLITMVYECDCLGMEVYPIDWLILLWVVARIANQVKKARDVCFKEFITNVWMLNDLASSGLFIIVIILKIYDLATYGTVALEACPFGTNANGLDMFNSSNLVVHKCTRSSWTYAEAVPITISEFALAVIYLLIHIRAMELLYTDRTFGPLQLSLDKMLVDTIRFLLIFAATFLAFAFAMTQLYWAWGRPKLRQHPGSVIELCGQGHEYDTTDCYPVYSYIYYSLLEQYWTLYGYGWGEEPPTATKIPTAHTGNGTLGYQGATEIAGQFVSMVFHVWAVVVMLNMLVAMMSHSFDRVRNNAELEWKFHRSGMWMKFIRKGVYPRPPPMNLIPSTRDLRSSWSFIKRKIDRCRTRAPSRHNARREASQEATKRENLKYRQAVANITQRYLRRYLLPDFKHDEIDQQPNRPNLPRRPSTIADDSS